MTAPGPPIILPPQQSIGQAAQQAFAPLLQILAAQKEEARQALALARQNDLAQQRLALTQRGQDITIRGQDIGTQEFTRAFNQRADQFNQTSGRLTTQFNRNQTLQEQRFAEESAREIRTRAMSALTTALDQDINFASTDEAKAMARVAGVGEGFLRGIVAAKKTTEDEGRLAIDELFRAAVVSTDGTTVTQAGVFANLPDNVKDFQRMLMIVEQETGRKIQGAELQMLARSELFKINDLSELDKINLQLTQLKVDELNREIAERPTPDQQAEFGVLALNMSPEEARIFAFNGMDLKTMAEDFLVAAAKVSTPASMERLFMSTSMQVMGFSKDPLAGFGDRPTFTLSPEKSVDLTRKLFESALPSFNLSPDRSQDISRATITGVAQDAYIQWLGNDGINSEGTAMNQQAFEADMAVGLKNALAAQGVPEAELDDLVAFIIGSARETAVGR